MGDRVSSVPDDVNPENGDVITKTIGSLRGIPIGSTFTVEFKGPAFMEDGGMDATLLAGHLNGTAGLFTIIGEETGSPVQLDVLGVMCMGDNFQIRYRLREKAGF